MLSFYPKGWPQTRIAIPVLRPWIRAALALRDLLRQRGIERIYVGGLATDYCVKETVLDGLMQGFQVVLLQDGICGVNLQPEDSAQAIDAMVKAGVTVASPVDSFRLE